jgi:hypothetical protein
MVVKAKGIRKTLLPTFSLTEVCNEGDVGAIERTISSNRHTQGERYFYRPVSLRGSKDRGQSDQGSYHFNLFPVVLDKNNVPWDVATLYVLSRLETAILPRMGTYSGIADDLASYLLFLDDVGINFAAFPEHKLYRPTYKYHGNLRVRIQAGEVAVTTARRRMSAVIAFYRWLDSEGLVKLANRPWNESDKYFNFKDSRGFGVSKRVVTTDLAINVPKQNDPFAETIGDGGQLRPLHVHEQLWLIDALRELGNTEMTLIHLVALLTGARIQTVLTLRLRHVRLQAVHGSLDYGLRIGPGTGVDTKGDKLMSLFIPAWLYEKLRTYSYSDRARRRRGKAVSGDNEDQYLFLSKQGVPYYQSKSDSLAFNPRNALRHSKAGQGVRQFISERIIPAIRTKHDAHFHYRFHDLRASFGMNLTDSQIALVESKKITLHEAREYVKTRMGHTSSATTDIYLNYRKKLNHARFAIADFERHLQTLLDSAMDGAL